MEEKILPIINRQLSTLRIVFMGTPEFAVASLNALVKDRFALLRGLLLHRINLPVAG